MSAPFPKAKMASTPMPPVDMSVGATNLESGPTSCDFLEKVGCLPKSAQLKPETDR